MGRNLICVTAVDALTQWQSVPKLLALLIGIARNALVLSYGPWSNLIENSFIPAFDAVYRNSKYDSQITVYILIFKATENLRKMAIFD